MKSLKAKRTQLTTAKNEQYEDFYYSRSRQRELQTIDANVRSILDLKNARNRIRHKTADNLFIFLIEGTGWFALPMPF